MLYFIYKSKFLFFILLVSFILNDILMADKVSDAIREAYQRGYADGLKAGEKPGSTTGSVPANVATLDGGSTTGFKKPLVYKFNNENDSWKITSKNKTIENKVFFRQIPNSEAKSEFNLLGITKGTIVFEDIPLKDLKKFDSMLKKSSNSKLLITSPLKN